ncbi:unnamed protein product [Clavelina lepadiformis]|uniref:Uncharacterized protein n=1 Tax=Clavelina lepadiformis TaxID=159417 RepID=A0ABP0GP23_CLALP
MTLISEEGRTTTIAVTKISLRFGTSGRFSKGTSAMDMLIKVKDTSVNETLPLPSMTKSLPPAQTKCVSTADADIGAFTTEFKPSQSDFLMRNTLARVSTIYQGTYCFISENYRHKTVQICTRVLSGNNYIFSYRRNFCRTVRWFGFPSDIVTVVNRRYKIVVTTSRTPLNKMLYRTASKTFMTAPDGVGR